MSRPVVVADSGPLIALACCESLHLLSAVFDAVHIPQAVFAETTSDGSRAGAAAIAAFARDHAQLHANRTDAIYAAAASHLDEGEAQALSLALALGCGILIDERRGRQAAMRRGLPLFGVLGVLLQAKRLGQITELAPMLERMQRNGYRVSHALLEATLKLANETASPS